MSTSYLQLNWSDSETPKGENNLNQNKTRAYQKRTMVIWVDSVSALINSASTIMDKLPVSHIASAAYVHGGKGSQSSVPTD